MAPLLVVGGVLIGLSWLIEVVFRTAPPKPVIMKGIEFRAMAMVLLVCVMFILIFDIAVPALPHINFLVHARAIFPYLNPSLVVAAMIAWVIRIWTAEHGIREVEGFLLFLAACVVATLTMAAIMGLYPWAVRRHLVYTVPLLAWLGGDLTQRTWDRSRSHAWARLAIMVGLLLVISSTAKKSNHAFLRTDFNGLSSVLARASSQLKPTDIVVADHFRWGTPLRLIYGGEVLNGEVIWQDETTERTQAATDALRRLHKSGRRIMLFTSTEQGPHVFPIDWGQLHPMWSSGPILIQDLIHHQRSTDFKLKSRTKLFSLYQWSDQSPPQ